MKKVIVCLVLFCGWSTSVLANGVADEQAIESRMQKISQQSDQLQHEVKSLKEELNRVKNARKQEAVHKPAPEHKHAAQPKQVTHRYAHRANHRAAYHRRYYKHGKRYYHHYRHQHVSPRESQLYTRGVTVTTSPYLGRRSAYDAQDLVVNLSTMNEDLRFLEQRQRLMNASYYKGTPFPARPIIELSGKITGRFSLEEPYVGPSTSDIDLHEAQLEVLAEVSPWATGFISLDYDNFALNPVLFGSGYRIGNSRVFVSRAFLTIGQLNRSPVYGSLGQMFVPFGRYATYFLSGTLPLRLGRTNARALLLGASHLPVYASAYVFRGDSNTGDSRINQFGFNLGGKFPIGKMGGGEIGAGYINNIADATGVQFTGGAPGSFLGFSFTSASETIQRNVPALDLHGEMALGPFTLASEYIGATRSFDKSDLSFNTHGARPQALHGEAAHKFLIFSKPTVIGVGYDRSWESLALNMPKHRYAVALSVSLIKDTIASFEYRYDKDYPSSDMATGKGALGSAMPGTGKNSNTYLAQFGVYF